MTTDQELHRSTLFMHSKYHRRIREKSMFASTKSVAEVMSHPVVPLHPGSRVHEALVLASAKGIHHFPLLEGGELRGVVCTCDLEHARPDSSVQLLAHPSVVTIAQHQPARDAAQLMIDRAVGSVVVTDGSRVCGIVTREDLLQAAPELALILRDERCESCQLQKHLRPGPHGGRICAACEGRARKANWLDIDGSD